MSVEGRWTPEFRAWFEASLSGALSDEQLELLDDLAQRAGERERERARRNERCSECGRPFFGWEELSGLLEELDGALSGAAASVAPGKSKAPGETEALAAPNERHLVGARTSQA